MKTNAQIAQILQENTEQPLLNIADFDSVNQTLKNVAESDSNTILYSWIVDIMYNQMVLFQGSINGCAVIVHGINRHLMIPML